MKFYKENKINPYASCLPIVFQIPIFIGLFFVLRDFKDEIFPRFADVVARVARPRQHHRADEGRLGAGAHRRLRREPAHVDVPHVDVDAEQGAALHDHVPPDRLPAVHPRFPSGLMIYWLTTNLWTTGQGLITRRRCRGRSLRRSARAALRRSEAEVSANGESSTDGAARPPQLERRPAPGQAEARRRRVDERVERHHRRGDRRDRRRGEVGRAARARVARAGPRTRARAVPGRVRGRTRAARRRASRRPT